MHVFDFIAVVCAFLFVDIFDTLGTLIGVATKADMLDKDGRLPRIKEALLADAVATTAGAVLGTSTTTTFVESSSGVAAGARTGLSVVTGFLFLISVVTVPDFLLDPELCDSTGSDLRRLPYGVYGDKHRVHGYDRGNSGILMPACNAVHVQHLRRYCDRRYLLCHHQCRMR